MRAVIIEDSKTQARRLADVLARDGFDVAVAHDGEKGVALCLAERPDLVVSDVLMPGIDGFEVCRRLRSDPRTADVPVMLLTSLGDPMDVLRALSAGASNFVTKPYRDHELLVRVRRILEHEGEPPPGTIEAHGEKLEIHASGPQILQVLYSALEDARARNEELEKSRAELERANAMRDEMMGIVAHELRTPLTTLSLRTQLARRHAKDATPETAELIDLVARTTDRSLRIIDDLLQVTKLDAGTLDIERRSTDVVALAREVVGRAQAAQPDFRIDVRGPDRIELRIDPVRIDQVLTNLVSNAVKYSGDAHEVDVTIDDRDDEICVRVRDRGIGIDDAQLERVFDRFYRTKAGQRAAGGFGLGLYVSRKLVELHGGRIGVESRRGHGSTFWFALPKSN